MPICHRTKAVAQGTTSLLTSSAPVWILGISYHNASSPEAVEDGTGLKQEVGHPGPATTHLPYR